MLNKTKPTFDNSMHSHECNQPLKMSLKFAARKVVRLPDTKRSLAIRYEDYVDYSTTFTDRRVVLASHVIKYNTANCRFDTQEQGELYMDTSSAELGLMIKTSNPSTANFKFDKNDIGYVIIEESQIMPGDIRNITIGDVVDDHGVSLSSVTAKNKVIGLRAIDDPESVKLADTCAGRLSHANKILEERMNDMIRVMSTSIEKNVAKTMLIAAPNDDPSEPTPKAIRVQIDQCATDATTCV